MELQNIKGWISTGVRRLILSVLVLVVLANSSEINFEKIFQIIGWVVLFLALLGFLLGVIERFVPKPKLYYVELGIGQTIKLKPSFKSKFHYGLSNEIILQFHKVIKMTTPPYPGLQIMRGKSFSAQITDVALFFDEEGTEELWIGACKNKWENIEIGTDEDIGYAIQEYLNDGWIEYGTDQNFFQWLSLLNKGKAA